MFFFFWTNNKSVMYCKQCSCWVSLVLPRDSDSLTPAMWKSHHPLKSLHDSSGDVRRNNNHRPNPGLTKRHWTSVFCAPFVYDLCLYCALRTQPFQVTDGWHFWTRHVVPPGWLTTAQQPSTITSFLAPVLTSAAEVLPSGPRIVLLGASSSAL